MHLKSIYGDFRSCGSATRKRHKVSTVLTYDCFGSRTYVSNLISINSLPIVFGKIYQRIQEKMDQLGKLFNNYVGMGENKEVKHRLN